MTTPTAITAEPRQMLEVAEKALAAGELRKGYYLVWDAAMAALKLAAGRRNFPIETGEDAWKFVCDLDGIDENGHWTEYPYHFGGLSVSESFLEQAQGIFDDEPEFRWEGDQFAFYLPAVRYFINSLLDLANDALTAP